MARGRTYSTNARSGPTRGRKAGRRRGRGRRAPLPFDSQAVRESAELGNEGADARASQAAALAQAQNQLGFGSGASNPYSDTALNRERLTNTRRGILTSSGNGLYSGSTLNKQSAATNQYNQAQSQTEAQIAEAQKAARGDAAATKRDEALGDAAIREGAVKRAEGSEPAPLAAGRRRRGRGRGAAPRTAPRNRGRGRMV